MTFDSIIPDSLWAVRYDGEKENAFFRHLINGAILFGCETFSFSTRMI